MNPHTRDVLEDCTRFLVEQGLTRKRRGLAYWKIDQEIAGAVFLQHRDLADGAVRVEAAPQVYWEPVERIFSAGNDTHYQAFVAPTRTRQVIFRCAHAGTPIFHESENRSESLALLRDHLHNRVLPKVKEMAEKPRIFDFYRSEVPAGGGRPEMYLAMSAWEKRSLDLDGELDWICSLLTDDQLKDSVKKFYARLKSIGHAQLFDIAVGKKP